jgi:nitrite reductase (NADH) large subunit
MTKERMVVVGNGMVGHHFLEQLVARGGAERFDILLMAEEPRLAYDRVHLSEYFQGRTAAELALADRKTYAEWGIEVHSSARVTHIDRENMRVMSEKGPPVSYDKLILATGSYPFVPPIPGADRPHCLTYRTIDDLGEIRASGKGARTGVVVGGGLLGLEAANALKNMGLEAHVVEFAPNLMSVQLDEGGSQFLRRKIEALGIRVHTSTATEKIAEGPEGGSRLRMHFSSGELLDTDMIVFSAGIRPRDELANKARLAMGERGGIIINDHCQTSDPDIFAIGECALHRGRIYGLVAPGYEMARTLAGVLMDEETTFRGADMSTKLKLLGVNVGAIGDAHGRTGGCRHITFIDEKLGVYKRINTSEDGKTLLGAVLVGDTEDYDSLIQYYLNGIALPEQAEQLILPAASGDKPGLGPSALPASATICSCHNVTKGDITSAVGGGCCSVADVKATTKASTGCGGCANLLKSVVDDALLALGVEVSNHVCSHLPYSRQEVFHIIQAEGFKTFDDLMASHGIGGGCDICKPLVASIMASVWNEHILNKPHASLQDTNDRYLANMQKDGTYSVVPRMPGGEVRPEQLIAIGEVAKKYDLYTKVTGGQRIDLFGARLEQLPEIWEALIAAGFETGHAYGKSLRTVKSCVGSTWCRYGVQDSVGMAQTLEHRYKGLRAPHKIKLAVSGCTRECAEAQCKDIGVIATEKGWNLYVCGNGGMRPRHADLFATDLDDKTLIRYIDRVLMFYVRTGDRLQRTSVWMENLEGGLEYLKKVVIEDSLGICEALEAQMQHVTDTYQCEWKTAVEDPEKRKRFRTYVNTDAPDSSLRFVRERGQKRPVLNEKENVEPVTLVRSA